MPPAPASATPRPVNVGPDHFEVAADDVVFHADVWATVVVCLYDAVEEPGGLLHLRFSARGQKGLDVTDRTLATDLLLLDRCVSELRALAPRAQNLQGKIAAHVCEELTPRSTADAVIALVTDYLKDADVTIVSTDVGVRASRLRFRPAMGQVHLDALPAERLGAPALPR
jgi:chemotaxis receptor (MCP) glutamine deamidase CheD